MNYFRHLACALCAALISACGGGGTANAPANAMLQVSEFLLAQTHVLPAAGLAWTLTDTSGISKTTRFELIANRDALAIIDLGLATPQNPALDIWFNGGKVASIAMNSPVAFPATEAVGPAFRSNSYTAIIPARWMKRSVDFKVSASNYQTSVFLGPVNIGNHPELIQYILPFYVYGASPGTGGAPTLAQTRLPDLATQQELFAKWPVAQLGIQTHPAGLIQWPYMVIAPRNGAAAYRALSKNDQKDGFATMSAVLQVVGAMRSANGEGNTNNSYYAPLMMWDNTGAYQPPGGGLGGGHRSTGDHLFAGIFIHELGHDFGLPHQGTAYLAGKYPYIDGSLKGSVWGYDQLRQAFLAPFVPSTAPRFANCLTNPAGRPTDAQGRCVKRDPMWGGNGDQATGYKFATFSDFSTAQIQTDLNAFTYIDPTSATGYSKWDAATKQRTALTVATTNNGLYGFDMGLPSQTNIPVYGIVITFSNAPCIVGNPGSICNGAGVDTSISQIYPPVSYTGNLRRVLDPTQAAQLAEIVPNTGVYPWFCMNGGCDYTVKVTYADTTTWHGLLQNGFRPWFKPTLAPDAAHQDPLNSASFTTWGINAPGGKVIAKIELLNTPQVWNGFPVAPAVLISR